MSRLRTLPWARLRGANNEGALVVLILMLAIAVGISTPAFWSASPAYSAC